MAQPVTFEFDKLTDLVDSLHNHVNTLHEASSIFRMVGHTYNDNASVIDDDLYKSQKEELEFYIAENLKKILSETYTVTGLINDIRSESANVVTNIKRQNQKESVAGQ